MSINKVLKELTPFSKLLLSLIVVAFISGTIYSSIQSSLAAMKGSIANSKASVAQLTTNVSTIMINQAVIKIQLEAEEKRSKSFRRSTSKVLDRILNKLQ